MTNDEELDWIADPSMRSKTYCFNCKKLEADVKRIAELNELLPQVTTKGPLKALVDLQISNESLRAKVAELEEDNAELKCEWMKALRKLKAAEETK